MPRELVSGDTTAVSGDTSAPRGHARTATLRPSIPGRERSSPVPEPDFDRMAAEDERLQRAAERYGRGGHVGADVGQSRGRRDPGASRGERLGALVGAHAAVAR